MPKVVMSFLRLVLQSRSLSSAISPTRTTPARLPRLSFTQRPYATKGKTKSTAKLIPGSQQPITDEAALEEYKKAESSMKMAAEWFRKQCQGFETRASGRVTPALLSPVRVKLGDKDHGLEEIATVGVRDGSILLVTLFNEKVSSVFSFIVFWVIDLL